MWRRQAPARASTKRVLTAGTRSVERGAGSERSPCSTDGDIAHETPAPVVGAGGDLALEPAAERFAEGKRGTALEDEARLSAEETGGGIRTPAGAPDGGKPRGEPGAGRAVPAKAEGRVASGEDSEHVGDTAAPIGTQAQAQAPGLGECADRRRPRKPEGAEHRDRSARAPGAEREVGPSKARVRVRRASRPRGR